MKSQKLQESHKPPKAKQKSKPENQEQAQKSMVAFDKHIWKAWKTTKS